MLISNTFNASIPWTVLPMSTFSDSLRNEQLIKNILCHCEQIVEYTVKKMSASSAIKFYRLVAAGDHSGDSLSYPHYDKEYINYVYHDFLESVNIEQEIADRELSYVEALVKFFRKGVGKIGEVNILIALLLKSTLIKTLKSNNYNQTEIDLIAPKISVLKAITGTGDCVVVRLEFYDFDGYKHGYIIEPLLNEIYQEEEIQANFKRLNFPAYASANTTMEIDRVYTGYVNDQEFLAYFSMLLSQQSDSSLRNELVMLCSKEQDKSSWTANEKNQHDIKYPNKFFAAAKNRARVIMTPLDQQQITRVIKNIINIATECMDFTRSIICYSSSRSAIEIAQKESFYLTKSAICELKKNVKNRLLFKYDNIIKKNFYFMKIQDNIEIDYIIPYTINLMHNTLNTRCGNCGAFAILTATLLALFLRKNLLAHGYDNETIESLQLTVQCVTAVESTGDHGAARLDFVINNRRRSIIFDSFVNKIFEIKNLKQVYSEYGHSCYIPENFEFTIDKSHEKLFINQTFLDAMAKMLSDMFGLDVNDYGATSPFKQVEALSEDKLIKMSDSYKPCDVTQKYGIPAYCAREANTLIPAMLSQSSSALYRLLRDMVSLPAALYRHAVEAMR
ncbi:hypothetical protein [Sodalis sp. RH16]|uniref:hypothetical protein n=1 Tax=Sodalis sp. RH16 TaxID=3394331 RepID=UPI0039B4835E